MEVYGPFGVNPMQCELDLYTPPSPPEKFLLEDDAFWESDQGRSLLQVNHPMLDDPEFLSYANQWSLINRLPNEILVMVMLALQASSLAVWPKVLEVCRHWNTVAVGTPVLWKYLCFKKKISFLRAGLARSNSIPIHVEFCQTDYSFMYTAVTLLSPHSRRLLSIKFSRIDRQCSNLLQQVVAMPKHELRSIELDVPNGAVDSEPSVLNISANCHRNLRELVLRGIDVLPGSSVLGALTKLHVLQGQVLETKRSLRGLSEVLRACVNLRNLWLNSAIFYGHEQQLSSQGGPYGSFVHLPSLRSLRVTSAEQETTRALLSFLRMPETAKVLIEDYPARSELISNELSRFVPTMKLCALPMLARMYSAEVVMSPSKHAVRGWPESKQSAPFDAVPQFSLVREILIPTYIFDRMDITESDAITYMNTNTNTMYWPATGFRAVVEIFKDSPVHSLRVDVEGSWPSTHDWLFLLQSFPNLRKLFIRARAPQSPAEGSIPEPQTPSASMVFDALAPRADAREVLCPGLKDLELEGFCTDERTLFRSIGECLNARTTVAGEAPAMEKLTLRLDCKDTFLEDCIKMNFETAFTAHVREVRYETMLCNTYYGNERYFK